MAKLTQWEVTVRFMEGRTHRLTLAALNRKEARRIARDQSRRDYPRQVITNIDVTRAEPNYAEVQS